MVEPSLRVAPRALAAPRPVELPQRAVCWAKLALKRVELPQPVDLSQQAEPPQRVAFRQPAALRPVARRRREA